MLWREIGTKKQKASMYFQETEQFEATIQRQTHNNVMAKMDRDKKKFKV